MSSMLDERIRADLTAAVSVIPLVATTPSFWVVYGDGTQSSAAMGSSPVAVASHVPGNMSSHVAPQVGTVSEEALPHLPIPASARLRGLSRQRLSRRLEDVVRHIQNIVRVPAHIIQYLLCSVFWMLECSSLTGRGFPLHARSIGSRGGLVEVGRLLSDFFRLTYVLGETACLFSRCGHFP